MSILLISSTLLSLVALGFSVALCYRLRDWRLSFLSLFLLLVVVETFRPFLLNTGRGLANSIRLVDLLVGLFAVLAVLFLTRTLTREKQLSRQLLSFKTRIQTLLDNLPEVVWMATPDGRQMLLINAATRLMYGREPEAFYQNPNLWLEAVHSEDRSRVEASSRELATREFVELEYRIVRPDGSTCWILDRKTMIRNEAGNPLFLAGVAMDITRRVESEQRLALNQKLIMQAEEALNLGIWEWDLATDRMYWSKHVEPLFGLQAGQFKGTFQAFLDAVVPEYRSVIQKAIAASLEQKQPYQVTYAILTPEGQTRWQEARGFVIRNARGEAVRMLGLVMDITEQKQAEQELRRTEEQLHALAAHLLSVREEERTMIAREMHDELGQVLTALKMDLSLVLKELKRTPLPKSLLFLAQEVQGMMDIIDRTIHRVRHLITELRPEILDHLDLPAAVRWQVQEFCRRSHIPCHCTIEGDFTSLTQDCRLAVFRILQEGLTNIARHARASRAGVILTARDDHLNLTIEDNGQGIPAEKVYAKTSFGLLGMQERVLLFNGKLAIHSRLGKGTRLEVELPLQNTKA